MIFDLTLLLGHDRVSGRNALCTLDLSRRRCGTGRTIRHRANACIVLMMHVEAAPLQVVADSSVARLVAAFACQRLLREVRAHAA